MLSFASPWLVIFRKRLNKVILKLYQQKYKSDPIIFLLLNMDCHSVHLPILSLSGEADRMKRKRKNGTTLKIKALFISRIVSQTSSNVQKLFQYSEKNYWEQRELIFIKIIIPLVCFLQKGQRAQIQLMVKSTSVYDII